jgi:hypothetical protein
VISFINLRTRPFQSAFVIWKNTPFDVPPQGPGLTTVTQAVIGLAMFVAGTKAVKPELLTRVVDRGAPFQLTVAPSTKPVPLTVRNNDGPPGAVALGTSG